MRTHSPERIRRLLPLHDALSTTASRAVVVFGLLLAAACDSATTPTPPPPAPLPNPLPPANQTLATGRVTDEHGLPIARASVSSFPPAVSTVTGGDGTYELSGAFGSAHGFGLLAAAEGYEPTLQWVPAAAEAVQNFRLRGIVRILAGEGVTVGVDANDTLYGSAEQYRARRVRIVPEATGTLVVEGSSSTGHPVLLSDQFFEYSPCCPARLDLAASTGREVTVSVLTFFTDVPAGFSLTTRLEAR
jgi:hypothetical protein